MIEKTTLVASYKPTHEVFEFKIELEENTYLMMNNTKIAGTGARSLHYVPCPVLVENFDKLPSKQFEISFDMVVPLIRGLCAAYKKHSDYQKMKKELALKHFEKLEKNFRYMM